MQSIFFTVAFLACVIGSICGMGGGVIIKPVLDAAGLLPTATINFLSGCTVLGMTLWNVSRTILKKETVLDLKTSTLLGIGAAVGGIAGKQLYVRIAAGLPDPELAGGIQACILLAATFATLLYTVRKGKIKSMHVTGKTVTVSIGLALGLLGAFLGIGGGPFNVAALCLFFSMPTKKAAQNSLYIILISQAASLAKTVLSGSAPTVSWWVLAGMVLCGVAGGEAGRRINGSLNEKQATVLFEGSMVLVMLINIYNILKFF